MGGWMYAAGCILIDTWDAKMEIPEEHREPAVNGHRESANPRPGPMTGGGSKKE